MSARHLRLGTVVLQAVPSSGVVRHQARRCNAQEPRNIAYNDLYKVCAEYFGKPRQVGTSHEVFKMPWPGDPRVNIQDDKGKAKAYQMRQVLKAIDKMEAE